MGFTRSSTPAHHDGSDHLSDEKAHLRKAIKVRLDQLEDKDRQAESRTLCRELLPHIPKGSTVCAYFPLKTEASLRPLMKELLDRGDSVFLPCFDGNKMVCRQMTDEKSLITGPFSIPEPSLDAPSLQMEDLDFALVPGRAFDKKGYRLGRGNGGYDKWIHTLRTKNTHAKIVGIALECQLVQQIPCEDHDEKVDALATSRGWIDC